MVDFVVKDELLQRIAAYLGSKPWTEVNDFIQNLNKVRPSQEDSLRRDLEVADEEMKRLYEQGDSVVGAGNTVPSTGCCMEPQED